MKILNINDFIKKEGLKEITNPFSFGRDGLETDDGLYSPLIFGTTSKEIGKTFGYINLNAQIMHPSVYQMIGKIDTLFTKCLNGTKKYTIRDGKLAEDEENGKNGVGWLYQNWTRIKFDSYKSSAQDQKTEKINKVINFVRERKNVFIDKFIVIPMKYRMKTEKNGIPIEDELTGLYKRLMGKISSGKSDNEFMIKMLQNSSKDTIIQNDVNIIYEYFLERLKGKEGEFRGTLISKRIDNNTRLVANARPDIPFNCCALPWHVLLNVFDSFIIGMFRDKEMEMDSFFKKLGIAAYNDSALGKHFNYIYQNSDTYVKNFPGKREIWIAVIKEMLEIHSDLRVMVKRDPAWSAGSYVCLKPIIIPTNAYHIIVNSLIYKPFGGDSFNTSYTADLINSNTIYKDSNCEIKTSNNQILKIKSTDNLFKKVFENE